MEPHKVKIQGTIRTQYQFCSNNIKPHFEKNHVATWSYNTLPKPQDLTSNHGCEKIIHMPLKTLCVSAYLTCLNDLKKHLLTKPQELSHKD